MSSAYSPQELQMVSMHKPWIYMFVRRLVPADNEVGKHMLGMGLKPGERNGEVSEYTVDELERRCEVKRPQGAQWLTSLKIP